MFSRIKHILVGNIIFITLIAMLGSCNSLQRLDSMSLKGDKFQDYLVGYYKILAQKEAKNYRWSDHQHFIDKAFAAKKGLNPLPENLTYWKIPQTKLTEFNLARKKLISLLYQHKLKNTHPEIAAKAQYNFDCWVIEQDSAWRPDTAYESREQFYKNLYQLSNLSVAIVNTAPKEQKIIPKPTPKIISKIAPKEEIKKIKPAIIVNTKAKIIKQVKKEANSVDHVDSVMKKIYYFNMTNNIAKLSPQHKATLSALASYVAINKDYHINILSYKNGTESDDEKIMIAKYRAQLIKDILRKHAINQDQISSFVFGNLTKDQIQHELSCHGTKVISIVVGNP